MKTSAIIVARMTSNRLPGKMLMDIYGKPALQRVVERVKSAKLLDSVIVATTTNSEDDPIAELCNSIGCDCFRGSEHDVLERILQAAEYFKVNIIVEITGDCPFIFHEHIDHLIQLHRNTHGQFDLTTNILARTFPRGFDIRIINTETLKKVQAEVDNDIDRQHALTWLYLNPEGRKKYKVGNWEAQGSQCRPDLQITLDTSADLELIRFLYSFEGQGYSMELTCEQVIGILDAYGHLEVCQAAKEVPRKDYFAELEEWYKKHDEGEIKQDVQCADNRRGRPRSASGRAGKRK